MSLAFWMVNGLIRQTTSVLCRIDKEELRKVPERGPLILYTNHIGSLEVPLLYAHLLPRRIAGIAKAETWDNRLMGWLFDLWDAIPVRRGEADLEAMRRSLEALERGEIFAIAPEGTRSRDGRLLRARPGVVVLALRSGAPLLPVAHWGAEAFDANLKKMRRTDFHIRVGEPFRLDPGGERVTQEVRQQMVDEMMYRLAALMPPAYRGAYADLENATEKYIRPSER